MMLKFRIIFLIAGCSLCISAIAQPDIESAKKAIEQIRSESNQAIARHDAGAIVASYAAKYLYS